MMITNDDSPSSTEVYDLDNSLARERREEGTHEEGWESQGMTITRARVCMNMEIHTNTYTYTLILHTYIQLHCL